MVGRNQHPESWFWETEEGRRWFIRFVVAVLYHFGLKRGVGAETISAFFACLHLEHVAGLRGTSRYPARPPRRKKPRSTVGDVY